MRIGRWLFAALFLALLVPLTLAQAPRRGGFGGGGSLFLLSQKSVQEELKMTDDQIKKLAALEEKQRESFKGFKDLSKEERQAKFQEQAKANATAVADILNPDQQKRLKQISLQQRGAGAIADPEVADALKLTDDQKSKLKDILDASAKERRDLFQPGGDRAEARKKMEDLQKATNDKTMAVLTDEQKTKLKELMGEPFKGEIRPPQFGGRGQKKKQ